MDSAYSLGTCKHLFLDDMIVERRENAEFTVNRPRKTYEKLVVANKPWESWMVNGWCSFLEDGGMYRMWYETRAQPGDKDNDSKLCYAESTDGLVWEKPSLGLVPFRGSKDNNLVYPYNGHVYHGGTVFIDPIAPPEERYKIIYLGTVPIMGVYGAHSSDGLHWTLYKDNPLIFTQSDTQSVCFWDSSLRKYVAYVRMNKPLSNPNLTRTIGRSETEDFKHWPPAKIIMERDAGDPPDIDLYNSAAFKYPYANDAYFIMTSVYHHTDDTLDVQLGVSRDGVSWKRPDRQPFIPLGQPDRFDSQCIYTSVGQVKKGNELWIYYWGSPVSHNANYPALVKYGGTISRAVLRLDGFVSLDAQKGRADVLTRPITFGGHALELNFQTTGAGSIQVELCDLRGRPHLAYSRKDCTPLRGDDVAALVHWNGSPDTSPLADQPVRLRFTMDNAKLYAFQFRG